MDQLQEKCPPVRASEPGRREIVKSIALAHRAIMGIIYAMFNHTKQEFVHPDGLPVDRSDPVSYPYSAFITNLLVNSWRHDHVVVFDDSGDIQCDWKLSQSYQNRSIELWNEFVAMYGALLPDLTPV